MFLQCGCLRDYNRFGLLFEFQALNGALSPELVVAGLRLGPWLGLCSWLGLWLWLGLCPWLRPIRASNDGFHHTVGSRGGSSGTGAGPAFFLTSQLFHDGFDQGLLDMLRHVEMEPDGFRCRVGCKIGIIA